MPEEREKKIIYNPDGEVVHRGIAVSPGTAIGAVLVIADDAMDIPERDISEDEVDAEIARFHRALEKTRDQLKLLQRNLSDIIKEKHAGIFDAHMLMTQDKLVIDEVENTIRNEKKNAECVFNRVIQKYIDALASMKDNYISERVADFKDVASRALTNMRRGKGRRFDRLPGQRIIIAYELTPSDTASLDRENTLAFATEVGSRTSHSAIMARAMEIPAVVGIGFKDLGLKNGVIVIVDGYKGWLIVNPRPSTLEAYARRESREEAFHDELLKESRLRPETLDRFRIQLAANIELPQDIDLAKRYGAGGIGLFRTEYLYVNRRQPPTLEEQFDIYKKLVEALEGYPLIVRTFDLGGDKLALNIAGGSFHPDPNPFLGCRAIRLHLDFPDLLYTQLKAILKASAFGNVKVMFPMITSMDEVGQLTGLVSMIKKDLVDEGEKFNDDIEVGIMIETPSAALIADKLAERVDFFSVGTNDLVQYALAVDRNNERVAHLYQPSHPAILKLVKNAIDAATAKGIWVSVCGEMAGDPRFVPLLVGMGAHELSMNPASIAPVRRLVRRLSTKDASDVLDNALKAANADEVLDLVEDMLYEIAPDIMNMILLGE
jgi:phosphotransferase system enzyme I (PtsI)